LDQGKIGHHQYSYAYEETNTFMTIKQQAVARAMIAGLGLAILAAVLAIIVNPFAYTEGLSLADRLTTGLNSALIPISFLAIAIGRLAEHRFFSPEDIDGAGLSKSSDRAKLLQALLQNTLEQSVLATAVYLAASIALPAPWLSVVPVAAILHGLGRALFFWGYEKGAGGRAFGFTLCFYPTLVMLVIVAGHMTRTALC
jgi:hypothetical protein